MEAESVAYLVCTWAGINAGAYSLPHVARWAKGDVAVVRETGEQVVIVAWSITDALMPARAPA